jgi:hypothetical protein
VEAERRGRRPGGQRLSYASAGTGTAGARHPAAADAPRQQASCFRHGSSG